MHQHHHLGANQEKGGLDRQSKAYLKVKANLSLPKALHICSVKLIFLTILLIYLVTNFDGLSNSPRYPRLIIYGKRFTIYTLNKCLLLYFSIRTWRKEPM